MQTLVITVEHAGRRLDQAIAALLPQHSRSRLQNWIRRGQVLVNGQQTRPRALVQAGDRIDIDDQVEPAQTDALPEVIPLQIVHEDEAILVLNKPAGLVVHPGAGNPRGTLLNALLHHDADLASVPRAGIVQRLDKDTSGIMVVARTPVAHTFLVSQLARRKVRREYRAIVSGVPAMLKLRSMPRATAAGKSPSTNAVILWGTSFSRMTKSLALSPLTARPSSPVTVA